MKNMKQTYNSISDHNADEYKEVEQEGEQAVPDENEGCF